MIKFRQKEFSPPSMKFLYGKNQVGNFMTRFKDKLPFTKKTALNGKISVMRKTIKQGQKLDYLKNLTINDPKVVVKKAAVATSKYPVAAAGYVGPLVTGHPLPGTSAVETALQQIPVYNKTTNRAQSAMKYLVGEKRPTVTYLNSGPFATRGAKAKYNLQSGLNDIGDFASRFSKAFYETGKGIIM